MDIQIDTPSTVDLSLLIDKSISVPELPIVPKADGFTFFNDRNPQDADKYFQRKPSKPLDLRVATDSLPL
jgi:hypothetical protein